MISSRARAAGVGTLVWIVVLGALLSIWTHAPVKRAPALTLVPVQMVETVAPTSGRAPDTTQTNRPSAQASRPPPVAAPRAVTASPSAAPRPARPTTPTTAPVRPITPEVRASASPSRSLAPVPPEASNVPRPPTTPDLASRTSDTEHAGRSGAASSPDQTSSAQSGINPPSAATDTGPPGTSAHAVFQPLPELPDEARDEAFTAVALARFVVHPDGQCDVSLIEPTRNPTLNRLLLASLRQWRFAAATDHGHAIETTVDLRVHFNVH